MATRDGAIERAAALFDKGAFIEDLARRVAIPTESQDPAGRPHLDRYLSEEMIPAFAAMGFTSTLYDNPSPRGTQILVAERIEDPARPTVLIYGHGDVIRGQVTQWRDGLHPWILTREGDRIYGRGVVDNKGQHSINMAALASVLAERGRLGFNARFLIEMGEETGSPGLKEFCEQHKQELAADLLIASDGPRLSPERPTLFMGARGGFNFDLVLEMRAGGGNHSGNWGGLLANPGVILAHALASMISKNGQILVPELKPRSIPNSVRAAIGDLVVDGGADGPAIDADWGEPGLTPAERVFGWNTFEILAFKTGNPDAPVNAIPAKATAHCQIRFTVDTDPRTFEPAMRRHLDANGFQAIQIIPAEKGYFTATRLDPDHPWARWAIASVARTISGKPAVIPNLGGSLPNDCFADTLGLPTVWVPHSYAGCSQHAPDEHALVPILREGLQIMAGLFWDLGDAPKQPAA